MKKLFLIFIIATKIYSQLEFNMSGYALNLPTFQKTNSTLSSIFKIKENSFSDLTRIRLRPVISLWEGARINIDYEIAAFYFNSTTPLNISTNNATIRQTVKLKWNLVNESNFISEHYFDRIYIKQRFSWGDLVFGRQRIAWGSGRVWNPTDLFNPINPANFFKIEKDGADAISSKIFLGNFTDLNIIANFTDKINHANYGFRFRTNYNEFDIAFIGGYFDKRYIIGFDLAGNLFDAGVRGESKISIDEYDSKDNFTKYIVGVDYQFTSKLYALLEYHYNGEGKKNKSEYEFLKLINGQILNMNKNYINATANYLIHPLVNLSLSETHNLNDGSGFVGFTIQYSYLANLDLSASAQFSYGDEYTEYWFYGNSMYLLGQFYF